MHHSQNQHSSIYMKIVKFDIFKLVKNISLGFGQLCAVLDVTFSQQQCDITSRYNLFLMEYVIQTGERHIMYFEFHICQ